VQAKTVGDVLERQLSELLALTPAEIVSQRYDRFRRLGQFEVS